MVLRALHLTDGVRVINGADATAAAASKLVTALLLGAAGVAQPQTAELAVGEANAASRAASVAAVGGFPLVLKAAHGSQGTGVALVESADRLAEVVGLLRTDTPYLLQEFVAAAAGSDVRVWVVGGRALAAMRRTAVAGFRANVHQGGSIASVDLTPQLVDVAVRAAAALGLDVAGVDLLQRKDGTFVVCEVNAAPGIEGE